EDVGTVVAGLAGNVQCSATVATAAGKERRAAFARAAVGAAVQRTAVLRVVTARTVAAGRMLRPRTATAAGDEQVVVELAALNFGDAPAAGAVPVHVGRTAAGSTAVDATRAVGAALAADANMQHFAGRHRELALKDAAGASLVAEVIVA